MNQSKAILNDSYKYLLSKFIPGIIGLLFVSIFTRVAGLSEYGKYSLLISQFNLVAALSYGWLIQSQLRYGSLRDNIEKPNILKLILFCSLITVPFIVLFNHLTPKLNFNFTISLICTISIGVFSYLKAVFQSELIPKQVLFLTLLQSIVYLSFPLMISFKLIIDSYLLIISTAFSFFISIIAILFLKSFFLKSYFLDYSNKPVNNSKWLKFEFRFRYGAPLVYYYLF